MRILAELTHLLACCQVLSDACFFVKHLRNATEERILEYRTASNAFLYVQVHCPFTDVLFDQFSEVPGGEHCRHRNSKAMLLR